MSRRLIKKTLGLCGGASLARRLTRYRPRILMYHGLTQDGDVRDWTQVHVDNFRAQMGYLKSAFHPISLEKLVDSLETGDISPLAVAVTFDDGYKSNLELALPILHEFGIPATIFVTSGFIAGESAAPTYLWPDLITMILLSIPENELDLSRLDAGKFAFSTLAERYTARNRLAEYLKTVENHKKDEIVDWMQKTYGRHIAYDRFPHFRPLSLDDLRRLAGNDLVTIGAHSRTHPILSRLKEEDLAPEIVGGKEDLERMTGRMVTQFAYPNGRRQDISDAAVNIVARHFACSVTTEPGLNPRGNHKYLLRRIGGGTNLPFDEFTTILSGLYYLNQKPANGSGNL